MSRFYNTPKKHAMLNVNAMPNEQNKYVPQHPLFESAEPRPAPPRLKRSDRTTSKDSLVYQSRRDITLLQVYNHHINKHDGDPRFLADLIERYVQEDLEMSRLNSRRDGKLYSTTLKNKIWSAFRNLWVRIRFDIQARIRGTYGQARVTFWAQYLRDDNTEIGREFNRIYNVIQNPTELGPRFLRSKTELDLDHLPDYSKLPRRRSSVYDTTRRNRK